MKAYVLAALMMAPALSSCGSVSLGVGVGGSSGGIGGGVSVSGDVARSNPGRVVVPMYKIDANGVGEQIGTLALRDTRAGLTIEPALRGLPPGEHGFHLHEKGDCSPGLKDGKMMAGMGAGGHYDPSATGKHDGPMGNGHSGDLPVLIVDRKGNATESMHALHVSVNDVIGRALVIHKGGDNFSDQPKPLGGGGERIACGVVASEG